MNSRNSLPARLGHWSARHRRVVIFGWLAFVVLALVIGNGVGSRQLTDADNFAGESRHAEQTLAKAGMNGPAEEIVLIQGRSLTVRDSDFRAAVADVSSRVSRIPVVQNVHPPLAREGTVSPSGHSALVRFEIKGDPDNAGEKVDPVLAQVAAAKRAHPQLRIEQFGGASADKELEGVFASDLHRAETLSLPITLAILLIAFGALAAAGVPLLLALSAVLATTGLVALPSHIVPLGDGSSSVILLIGMAVGIDYSLFYMRREREERARGADPATALRRAAQTSGRAVLVSGLTVMTAMAGMFLSGDKGFMGMGIGTMIVVGVAVAGSLTVVPAILSWLGDRVQKGRVPFVARRRQRSAGASGVWTAIIDRALCRPAVSAALAAGVLIALTIPAFGMTTKVTSPSDLPQNLAAVQAYNHIQAAFPGENTPASVVIKARNVHTTQMSRAIGELKQRALATGEMHGPIETDYSKDGTVANVSIPIAGDGADAESTAALSTLRQEILPATIARVPGAEASVTGMTAQTVDSSRQLSHAMPIVFGFVLALAFMLLLLTFRSIVIPLKAIALNLLSVGAAYGVLTLVFQNGHGASLLGAHATGGVASWLPLFLFVVLFGLSMDYHVFILSRIREAVDRGMPTEDAVAHGIKSTAGVVTSAAAVMVAVFAIFATLTFIEFKEMGVGLAAAVLIDATIVRGVLLPATMKLLGKWNWYLPRSLRWLPRVAPDPELARAQA